MRRLRNRTSRQRQPPRAFRRRQGGDLVGIEPGDHREDREPGLIFQPLPPIGEQRLIGHGFDVKQESDQIKKRGENQMQSGLKLKPEKINGWLKT